MTTVYIIAIIALAVVVLAVAALYVGRLKSGSIKIRRDGIDAQLNAQPDKIIKKSEGDTPGTPLQPGKTVVDDDLLLKSRISAPKNSDVKIRRSKLFGSQIEIQDQPSKRDDDEQK